ncbi:MAG: hypothetical protein LUH54_01590 [Firmicutes bacterium]|nr:hypothetical protein [Bacillota bacterium]
MVYRYDNPRYGAKSGELAGRKINLWDFDSAIMKGYVMPPQKRRVKIVKSAAGTSACTF